MFPFCRISFDSIAGKFQASRLVKVYSDQTDYPIGRASGSNCSSVAHR